MMSDYGGEGGAAIKASRSTFWYYTLSPDGRRMYIADLLNKRIGIDMRIVTTIAGTNIEIT
jgi:hypothetical protein